MKKIFYAFIFATLLFTCHTYAQKQRRNIHLQCGCQITDKGVRKCGVCGGFLSSVKLLNVENESFPYSTNYQCSNCGHHHERLRNEYDYNRPEHKCSLDQCIKQNWDIKSGGNKTLTLQNICSEKKNLSFYNAAETYFNPHVLRYGESVNFSVSPGQTINIKLVKFREMPQ